MLGVRPNCTTGLAAWSGVSECPEKWTGLIGAWCPFLGKTGSRIVDYSGHNLHGTSGGSYSWSRNRLGAAWYGNGGTNQIQIISPESAGGILNPTNVSVLAWVKTISGVADQDIATVWKVGDAANQSYLLWIDQPVWEFLIRTSGGSYAANSGANVVANELTQVCGTYDGETVRLYIDNALVGINTTPSGNLQTITASDAFWISEKLGQQQREFGGTISLVLLFDHALTTNEIIWHHQQMMRFM